MTWGLVGESSSKKRKWKVHSYRSNRGSEGAVAMPLEAEAKTEPDEETKT